MPDLDNLIKVLLLRGVIDNTDYDYIYETITEAQWMEKPFEFKKDGVKRNEERSNNPRKFRLEGNRNNVREMHA